MKKTALSLPALAALLCLTSTAYAQATRTWVSGLGNDADPCSRTAPCKTFAGAFSKTAAGGEINVLDSGGFGAVTITKALTISAEGVTAGVLVSGTNGIVISAGASDVVTLRGLDIDGIGTGLNGIRFLSGKALHVQTTRIYGFTQAGIDFEPNQASAELEVQDSIVSENATGVLSKPVVGGSAKVSLERVSLVNNSVGFRADATSGASNCTLKDSRAAGNTGAGIDAFSAGATAAVIMFDQSTTVGNGTGILSETGSGATVRISNSTVTGNATGLSSTGGGIVSYKTNNLVGNAVEGAPTSFIIQN